MLGLEGLQAPEEDVVFRIADLGRIEVVVRTTRPLQFVAQSGRLVGGAGCGHGFRWVATRAARASACRL